ncbi:MAG: MerR family transcriptional regulator [Bacillota bacterium]|nr:MerR family transcriptional regulator [Bacillota bacterium]
MDIYSIGELVEKLGINKETIRYYERIGLLSEPARDKNGYRIYSSKDLEMIHCILIVKNFGFSLKEISRLIHDEILCGDIESIRRIVEDKLTEVDNKINELVETKNLLEKVKEITSMKNIECSNNLEKLYKK